MKAPKLISKLHLTSDPHEAEWINFWVNVSFMMNIRLMCHWFKVIPGIVMYL